MEYVPNDNELVPFRRPMRDVRKDFRGILADMGIAQVHPVRPDGRVGNTKRLMYAVHALMYQTGRLANVNYDRKVPEWPLPSSAPNGISVLSYGSERIAYNVRLDDGRDMVLGVFHRESLLQAPREVAQRKRQHHETYLRYFDRLVWPTAFLEVDNPWGEGMKPASLQLRFGETEELGLLPKSDVARRLYDDPDFAADFQTLVGGYNRMLEDGLCPDFATSNVLLSGSQIILPDTGLLYDASKLDSLKRLHPTFELLESFGSEMR